MIGYYVHHHGRGHQHRAQALVHALDEEVVGLSSLPRPADWSGRWVELERDDLASPAGDPTAGGRLHWVPTGDPGLSRRMRQLSTWLDEARPRLLVVDVSVEAALLARLHGVPVLVVMQPGRRDDPAHLLGYDVADRLVAFWPPAATADLLPGLPDRLRDRVQAVGALSRFPVAPPSRRRPGPRRAVVLSGAGGPELTRAPLPGWEWTVLGRSSWRDDPRAVLADADVVVTHAGQNAVAEVAALRRPAVVVAQDRPHDEQRVTAAVLRAGDWPVADEVAHAAELDGDRWSAWCDGDAAHRFAAVVAA
ncbi:MAG TPA: glycosyltransferase [Nocardioides sp.]|nr:glycosyltransferase [Nocardioides sp.]